MAPCGDAQEMYYGDRKGYNMRIINTDKNDTWSQNHDTDDLRSSLR
jgi:hypothetical protein